MEGAELARMSAEYKACAEVDKVVGAVGPFYYASVEVEGVPTEAMIDPGSSATILSFQLFKQIGKQARIPSTALRKPDRPLRDYSQRLIPIGAQVDLTFSWQGKTVRSPVYLRSDVGGSGEPCLLGTNVVIPLGLMTPAPGVEPRGPEGMQWPEQCARIQLVQGVRVPAGCAVMAEVQISGTLRAEDTFLFEPSMEVREKTGLQLEDILLDPDDHGKALILVQNPGRVASELKPEDTLGMLEMYQDEIAEEVDSGRKLPSVARVSSDIDTEHHCEQLGKGIDIGSEGLTQDERQALLDYVC